MLQMESLLELVQMEQNIYNTVFHEVIRQATVSCAERGQLLAKLRLAVDAKSTVMTLRLMICALWVQTALPVAPGANPPLSEGPAH